MVALAMIYWGQRFLMESLKCNDVSISADEPTLGRDTLSV
jgi:hypothetical protein